jgi:hypothetical protein
METPLATAGCFPMVSKEGQPAIGQSGSLGARFIQREMFLRKFKTEHTEFPVNPRRSPGGVLNEHSEDQFPNLLRCPFPSNLPPDSGN